MGRSERYSFTLKAVLVSVLIAFISSEGRAAMAT
jgi:hypothetical protein